MVQDSQSWISLRFDAALFNQLEQACFDFLVILQRTMLIQVFVRDIGDHRNIILGSVSAMLSKSSSPLAQALIADWILLSG